MDIYYFPCLNLNRVILCNLNNQNDFFQRKLKVNMVVFIITYENSLTINICTFK